MKTLFLLLICSISLSISAGTCPPPLDYTQSTNWFMQPQVKHKVDVFYLYPTCVNDTCSTLINTIDSATYRAVKISYNKCASAFAEYANIFTPYYRQITNPYILGSSSREELIQIARTNAPWADVKAALDYYFHYLNPDRPFIFVGLSQGSILLQVIMEDYLKAHPELKKRIVAIYAIGWGFTQTWCDEVDIPFATKADDTGCLISWNTEGPGEKTNNALLKGNILTINPLNWRRDTVYAGVESNLGGIKCNNTGEWQETDGWADAQLDLERHVVVCTTDTNYVPFPSLLGEKSLHLIETTLYYGNLRANGLQRIEAYWHTNNIK